MNLNPLILTNIQSSHYFKGNYYIITLFLLIYIKLFQYINNNNNFLVILYELKTYHEVIDEIYYKVTHLEPWEKGSRKTAGQTGMCGGVSKDQGSYYLFLIEVWSVIIFSLFISFPSRCEGSEQEALCLPRIACSINYSPSN